MGVPWGDLKLGRMPAFVRDDGGQNQAMAQGMSEEQRRSCREQLDADAAVYKRRFDAALQYFQARCQHHIHPLRTTKKQGATEPRGMKRCRGQGLETEIRIIPNACRAKGKPNECKHEAPWTNKLNCGRGARALLVCPGLAKKRKLRRSGARNMVGSTLFVRNSEWLNGTVPGFCFVFGGSNTDVQPNDLLPILPQTHEDDVPPTYTRIAPRVHGWGASR